MIVSFSGIDSAGKSTQIALLKKYCDDHRIKYTVKWSKARGTPGVLLIKEFVRKDKKMDPAEKAKYREEVFSNPKKERLLYIASMLDLCWYWGIYYRIHSCLHKFLICDRYIWDTYVEIRCDFKGINIDNSKLWWLVRLLAPKPMKAFVFTIPPEVSVARDQQKNASGIESMEVKKGKIDLYMQCVKNGCWTDVMDGLKPIEILHEEIINTLGLV